MKPAHFPSLLKLECFYYARFIFLPVMFAGQILLFSDLDFLAVGAIAGLLSFMGSMAIFLSYGFLFQDGGFGFRRSDQGGVLRTLEFPFSRAIDRRAIYRARLVCFIGSALLPLLAFVATSLGHPDREIAYYSRLNPTNPAIPSFYLGHFPGAALRTSQEKVSIVLPHWRLEFAVAALWAGLIAAAGYQALMLGTLRSRWAQRILPFVCCIGPAALLFASGFQIDLLHRSHSAVEQPPGLDQALAWAIHHPLPPLLAGAVFLAWAFRFGSQRFARQEATT